MTTLSIPAAPPGACPERGRRAPFEGWEQTTLLFSVRSERVSEVDIVAIIMRIIQRFQTAKKIEFMELEKQFAALEHQGILLKGERMTPLASREPGNTLIWQRRFRDLSEADEALRFIANNADHTRLYEQQKQYMEDTWLEFYEVLDY